jgi:hypothetical protein
MIYSLRSVLVINFDAKQLKNMFCIFTIPIMFEMFIKWQKIVFLKQQFINLFIKRLDKSYFSFVRHASNRLKITQIIVTVIKLLVKESFQLLIHELENCILKVDVYDLLFKYYYDKDIISCYVWLKPTDKLLRVLTPKKFTNRCCSQNTISSPKRA